MSPTRIPSHGGGWPAILYTLRKARAVGGFRRMWKALRTRNACKTCALGMGGQRGGMVDEAGHFPEVCKKSVQAMAADMQKAVSADVIAGLTFDRMKQMTPRALEHLGRITTPCTRAPMDDRFKELPWDDAMDKASAALKRTKPERSFYYLSGRSSNEAGFVFATSCANARHQQRQQLFVLLSPSLGCWFGKCDRVWHRNCAIVGS